MFEFLIGVAVGGAVMVVFPKVYNFILDKYTGIKSDM